MLNPIFIYSFEYDGNDTTRNITEGYVSVFLLMVFFLLSTVVIREMSVRPKLTAIRFTFRHHSHFGVYLAASQPESPSDCSSLVSYSILYFLFI